MTDPLRIELISSAGLSENGKRRRAAILLATQGEMRKLRRVRRRRRAVFVGTACIVMAMSAGWLVHGSLSGFGSPSTFPPNANSERLADGRATSPDSVDSSHAGNAMSEALTNVTPTVTVRTVSSEPRAPEVIVRTDPDALARAAMPVSSSGNAEIMTDEELLDLLASLGQPAGLIRVGDDVRLTTEIADLLPEASF